jgi:hypothetical protein
MMPSNTVSTDESPWQTRFIRLLPEIEKRLKRAFRHLDAERREDAIAEAVAHSMLSYRRLHQRGVVDAATASTIAHYSTLQVKQGRTAVGRMNGREPLSRYAQLRHGIQVTELHDNWIYELINDRRVSVPDQVAAKIDFGDWFATLSKQLSLIASDLAQGFSTSETASKYGVTAGRVSQIRKILENSWTRFQEHSSTAIEQ